MYLSDSSLLRQKSIASQDQIVSLLIAIKDTLALSDQDFLNSLGLTEREFKSVSLNQKKLKISALHRFTDCFELSLDAFMAGQIDLVTLSQHYKGNENFIPLRFSIAAQSKIRSVQVYLDYLSQKYGYHVRSGILKQLQLTEASCADANRAINILFFEEFTQALAKRGFLHNDFYLVGQTAFAKLDQTFFSRAILHAQNLAQAYDLACELLRKYVETNCSYSVIKAKQNTLWIKCTQNQEIAAVLGKKRMGSKLICNYKRGLFSIIPKFFGLPECIVSETECLHSGAPSCLYEVKMDHAAFTRPIFSKS